MIELLTNSNSIERASHRIKQLIGEYEEWFYFRPGLRATSPMRSGEIHFRRTKRKLILSCVTDAGLTIWRIRAWEWTGEKFRFEVTSKNPSDLTFIELTPRASASVIAALVSDSRRVRCQLLAQLVCSKLPGARIVRMGLSAGARSGQPGRDARIWLERKNQNIGVSGNIADGETSNPDSFLSSTIIWFTRSMERARKPTGRILVIVAKRDKVEPLLQRIALLREDLRKLISIYEIDDEWKELTSRTQTTMKELVAERPARMTRPSSSEISDSAARLRAVAPEAIDVVRARNGETLRYHGLPFARVRRVFKEERVWFGLESSQRRLLDQTTESDLNRLIDELLVHRCANPRDRRHALYRASPEAWLESLLRRDISKLDPGLRLAPIHAQFRTSPATYGAARPIDLLALRQDGRLAVIELKVSEDRDHVFQGADYWRRVETHRRRDNIRRAKLFDDAFIADESPLVYLAAPLLSFHRAFSTLANSISPVINIYRFDLNEDWRTGVSVTRRVHVNQRFISYDESGSC